MPDPDLTFQLTDARDESTPERDGTFTRVKRYTFYLGKYGPFVERIPLDNADPYEFNRRRDTIAQHLRDIHR